MESPVELDWRAFCARYFPGRRRPARSRALVAYGAFRNSVDAQARPRTVMARATSSAASGLRQGTLKELRPQDASPKGLAIRIRYRDGEERRSMLGGERRGERSSEPARSRSPTGKSCPARGAPPSPNARFANPSQDSTDRVHGCEAARGAELCHALETRPNARDSFVCPTSGGRACDIDAYRSGDGSRREPRSSSVS
jgi:hypothetical protein